MTEIEVVMLILALSLGFVVGFVSGAIITVRWMETVGWKPPEGP